MTNPFSVISARSRRTNFLSVGVTLCVLIAGICVAPLAFVQNWIAAWLLTLFTILVLGTFGIWAKHAVNNPSLLDTEDHRERMQAIALLGAKGGQGDTVLQILSVEDAVENPLLPKDDMQ